MPKQNRSFTLFLISLLLLLFLLFSPFLNAEKTGKIITQPSFVTPTVPPLRTPIFSPLSLECSNPTIISAAGSNPDISGRNVVFTDYTLQRTGEIFVKDLGKDHIAGTSDDGGIQRISNAISSASAEDPRIDDDIVVWYERGMTGTNLPDQIIVYSLGNDGVVSADDVGPITVYTSTANWMSPPLIKQDILTFTEYTPTGNIVFYCATDNLQSGCFIRSLQQLSHLQAPFLDYAVGVGDSTRASFALQELNRPPTTFDLAYIDEQGTYFSLLQSSLSTKISDSFSLGSARQIIVFDEYDPQQPGSPTHHVGALVTYSPSKIILSPQSTKGFFRQSSPIRIAKTLSKEGDIFVTWDDARNGGTLSLTTLNEKRPLEIKGLSPSVDDNTLVYVDSSLRLVARECKRV